MKKTYISRFRLFLVLLLVPLSCQVWVTQTRDKKMFSIDLNEIRQRGRIIAVTDYNSSNYFIYNGRPMGFQLDLLRYFTQQKGLELEVVPSKSIKDAFNMLNSGAADLIAMNLTVTGNREAEITFTEPWGKTHQVLVQRNLKSNKIASRISDISQLNNRVLYLAGHSAYVQSIEKIQEELGIHIQVVESDLYEDEDLIKKVALGEIEFTVTDANTALTNQVYYPQLDISVSISDKEDLAWAVRKDSPQLEQELNQWIVKFKRTTEYAVLYHKYFSVEKAAQRKESRYWSVNHDNISVYDPIIKRYARQIGWDWRLLASVIFQESRFKPGVSSNAGAYGLMQIMPSTGEQFKVDVYQSPEHNVMAGIRFIKKLDSYFKDSIPNQEERVKFILASYNAGLGHVQDARRLARKNGKDPNVWKNNVDIFLLQKAKPEYYTDKDVKHGYLRGRETYNYVKQVLTRYNHYKNLLPE